MYTVEELDPDDVWCEVCHFDRYVWCENCGCACIRENLDDYEYVDHQGSNWCRTCADGYVGYCNFCEEHVVLAVHPLRTTPDETLQVCARCVGRFTCISCGQLKNYPNERCACGETRTQKPG